ncbi:hypothetical protein G9A89_003821 [Geosiphon pyriformis]|nr:hypothetical protein G9A89_003821 [Geosiphon pyriformis]
MATTDKLNEITRTETKIIVPPEDIIYKKIELHAYYAAKVYYASLKKKPSNIFVTVDELEKTLVVSIRHKNSKWFGTAKRLTPYKMVHGAMVEIMTYKDYLESKDKNFKNIYRTLKRFPGIKKISFTGHFLGGVLAIFTALDFKTALREMAAIDSRLQNSFDIEVFTFGAPRIGNRSFAQHVNQRFKVYRVTLFDDYSSNYPHASGTYGFFHHNTEYWIPLISDCACEEEQTKLYKCLGPNEYMDESKDCNDQEWKNSSVKKLLRQGPYFGQMMGKF